MSTWIGAIIGAIGLAFAYYQYQKRAKLESVVQDALRRLAGDMRVLFSNASWADLHFRKIGYMLTQANPDLIPIKQEALDGARDSAACARQLTLAHSKIRGIQRSLFNDSEEILPEIRSEDVVEAHRKINEQKAPSKPQTISEKVP